MNIFQRHRMKNYVRVAYRGGQWSDTPSAQESSSGQQRAAEHLASDSYRPADQPRHAAQSNKVDPASNSAHSSGVGERWSFDPLTALVLSAAIVLVSAWFMWGAGATEPNAPTSSTPPAAIPEDPRDDALAAHAQSSPEKRGNPGQPRGDGKAPGIGESGAEEGAGERGFKLRREESPAAHPADDNSGTGKQGQIVVHVAGAVQQPGIVTLPADARTYHALEAAGGPTPEADTSAINLASHLHDGDFLYVAREGEAPPHAHGGVGPGPSQVTQAPGPQEISCVDINTASAEELENLPGVGPALSQRIVDHRNAHGPFARIEDLDEVSGIGIRMINRIRPAVCS